MACRQWAADNRRTGSLACRDRQVVISRAWPSTNDLAKRGYSRDHRRDCKQIVLALVVTREGFPLAHQTLAGNTRDLQTVRQIIAAIEARFGQSNRVWVMDRGMISEDTLAFLNS
jgi:transposase